MKSKISEIAERIRGMRSSCELSQEQLAEATGVPLEEYVAYEQGEKDFPYSFLHRCAEKFGIDIVELLTGESPHLKGYTVVRDGKGLQMNRREGFGYFHRAAMFKSKISEPFVVVAPFRESDQLKPVEVHQHAGQEFDYVLEGKMRFVFEDHEEILGPGDSVYYDSGRKHGMITIEGKPCKFIAVVIKHAEDRDAKHAEDRDIKHAEDRDAKHAEDRDAK
jgi:mannose-6-phosphate isomerase-like protein (cupin superfamily)